MKCYLCESTVLKLAEYTECSKCGLVRSNQTYEDSAIYNTEYAIEYYKRHKSKKGKLLNEIRLDIIKKIDITETLLDIGCGVGSFINHINSYNGRYSGIGVNVGDPFHVNAIGFEVNPVAFEMARNICGAPYIHRTFDMALKYKRSIITMFDVIEHIAHPITFLKKLRRGLVKGGHLVVTTPDLDGRLIPLQTWRHFKPQEHLFYYNENTMRLLLDKCGFKVIHIAHEEDEVRTPERKGKPNILTVVAKKC